MKNSKSLLIVVSLSVVLVLALSACGDIMTSSRPYIPGKTTPGASGSTSGSNSGSSSGSTGGSTGGTNAPTTSNGQIDSCAIVKKEDFAPYVGGGEITQEGGRGDCTYYSVGLIPTVLLVAADRGDAEDFKIQKQVYAGLGGAFSGATEGPLAGAGEIVGITGETSDVKGLGDESFWTGGILITRKGNVIITMSFPAAGVDGKSKFDALKELTQKAVTRL